MAVTDGMHHDRPSSPAGDTRTVKLTPRDVEDARRLLSLLTSGERLTIDPPTTAGTGALQRTRLVARAEAVIADRRRRYKIFGKAMFGEPGWDMLLLLFVFDGAARQSVSSLTTLSDVSSTTGLRWIHYLEKQQLVRLDAHPTDRRALFVELTDNGRTALELYLSGTVAAGA